MEFIMKLFKLIILILASTSSLLANLNDDFIQAAECGNLEQVENCLSQEVEVNAIDNDGLTALMWAAENGHLSVVQYLIEHRAEVNAKTNYGWTALMWAAESGHLAVVQYLVEQRAEVNATTNSGLTALMEAAFKGHLSVVLYLIEHGAEVNATTNSGSTALMEAAEKGCLSVVSYLIEHRAEVDAKNIDGLTALMWATRNGHKEIAALLELCNQPGFEELRGAGQEEMANFFELPFNELKAPKQLIFLWSIILNKHEVFARLLSQGISTNTRDKHGMTALMYAVIAGNKSMVQILVNNDAQIHRENEWGQNAIQVAANSGQHSIATGFILRQKIGINIW
jgi:ankyrin repeat protein